MRILTLVVGTLVVAASLARGQGQAAFPSVVLFVDDLHIAPASTPQLRVDLQKNVTRLVASGRSVAVLTDAAPSTVPQPTTDPARLAEMVNRVKGSGVRSAGPREIANRDTRARDTLRQAVERLQPSAVIYVTEKEVQPSGFWMPVFLTTPKEIAAAVARALPPLALGTASGYVTVQR